MLFWYILILIVQKERKRLSPLGFLFVQHGNREKLSNFKIAVLK